MWYECNHSMAFRKFMQRECEAILNEIQTKYPHLEIVWATLHMDEPEGTPHLHIAYQPVGDRYKQGLSERVCLGNALACDGIERIKDRGQADEEGFQQRRFYNRMEDYVKSRLKTDELKHWTQEEITIKERVSGRKHLDPKVYKERKAAEDEKNRLEAENIALKAKNAELHADLDSLFDQLAEEKEKVINLQSERRTMEQELDDLQAGKSRSGCRKPVDYKGKHGSFGGKYNSEGTEFRSKERHHVACKYADPPNRTARDHCMPCQE